MKILPSLILSLILLVFWSCSDFGVVDNDCSSVVDCAGECGGSAVIDCAGDCGGVAEEDNGNCINISYTATIQPIFDADCTGCHGGSSGLYLNSYDNLISSEVVVAGDSTNSLLIKKLKGTAGTTMPKDQNPLSAQIITLIATWIQEGALEN